MQKEVPMTANSAQLTDGDKIAAATLASIVLSKSPNAMGNSVAADSALAVQVYREILAQLAKP